MSLDNESRQAMIVYRLEKADVGNRIVYPARPPKTDRDNTRDTGRGARRNRPYAVHVCQTKTFLNRNKRPILRSCSPLLTLKELYRFSNIVLWISCGLFCG